MPKYDFDLIKEHDRAASFARSLHRLEVLAALAGRVRRVGIVTGKESVVIACELMDHGIDTLGRFARLR